MFNKKKEEYNKFPNEKNKNEQTNTRLDQDDELIFAFEEDLKIEIEPVNKNKPTEKKLKIVNFRDAGEEKHRGMAIEASRKPSVTLEPQSMLPNSVTDFFNHKRTIKAEQQFEADKLSMLSPWE